MMKTETRTTRLHQTLWRLHSHFRLKKPCKGGNLVKIATQQCTVFDGKKRCEVKCNGSRIKDPTTRFEFLQKRGKSCIQYIHDQNITYTLKVVKNAMVTFEEGRCDSNSDDNILFEGTRVGRLYQYKYLAVNRTMCIGVHDNCSHNLSLISTSSNRRDGRCLFKKQRSKLSATK